MTTQVIQKPECRKCKSTAVGSARVKDGVKHRCTVCGRSWKVRDVVEVERPARELPHPSELWYSGVER